MLPIEVLANPDCAHCRQAIDEVTEAGWQAGVPVAGADLRRHPELALAVGLEHSPLFRVGAHLHAEVLNDRLIQTLLAEARQA